MTEKEKFKKELFDLKFKQCLHIAEHKESSQELQSLEKELKKVYVKRMMNRKKGR